MNFPFSHHLAMCTKLRVFLSILMQMRETSQFSLLSSFTMTLLSFILF